MPRCVCSGVFLFQNQVFPADSLIRSNHLKIKCKHSSTMAQQDIVVIDSGGCSCRIGVASDRNTIK